ncbi:MULTISPECIES: hypothetical protein [Bradyrhizobium]
MTRLDRLGRSTRQLNELDRAHRQDWCCIPLARR